MVAGSNALRQLRCLVFLYSLNRDIRQPHTLDPFPQLPVSPSPWFLRSLENPPEMWRFGPA